MPIAILRIGTDFGKCNAKKTSMAAQTIQKEGSKAKAVAGSDYIDRGTSHLSIIHTILDDRTCTLF